MTKVLADRIRFMRRVSGALLVSTALLWIVLVDRSQHNSLTTSTVALRALAVIPKHPVVYTFRENHNDDDEELERWKHAWTIAGWDARVLTIQDAARHPSFDIFRRTIGETIPFGHDQVKLGYYRYLAMSSVGGGWLTDTTVLPLWSYVNMNRFYPGLLDETDFTVRCSRAKKSSPCLMSGSRDEWTRMAAELAGSIRRHHAAVYDAKSSDDATAAAGVDSTIPLWTSELALEELVSFGNPTGRPRAAKLQQVITRVQADELYKEMPFSEQQCVDFQSKLAIQFGKEDFGNATLQALRWMTQWGLDCAKFQVFDYHQTKPNFSRQTGADERR